MPSTVKLSFLKMVCTSEHVPILATGKSTHDAARDFVAQIVRHTREEDEIRLIVGACLPEDYNGDTLKEVGAMITGAVEKGFHVRKSGKGKKSPLEELVELVLASGVELFHSTAKRAFIGVPSPDGGQINYPVRSVAARTYIQEIFYRSSRKHVPPHVLDSATEAISAMAVFDGKAHEIFIRVGRSDDCNYIDLGRDDGKAIQISAAGYSVVTSPNCKFIRMPGMAELPIPQPGEKPNEGIKAFSQLLGLEGDNATLVVAFMLASLRPAGPYFCLAVDGQQGSGKSLLCELIKAAIDPTNPPRSRLPGTEQDLMIMASVAHITVFDNTSFITYEISDALASLATGTGFQRRKLYSDDELVTFAFARPFALNGIGDVIRRPDLMERAIPINLTPLKTRKREEAIKASFIQLHPLLLHDLLEAACTATRDMTRVSLEISTRMIDAVTWLTAAEPTLEMDEGTFVRVIDQAQGNAQGDLADSDIIGSRLLDVLKDHPESSPLVITAAKLLEMLRRHEDLTTVKLMPKSAASLSRHLRRMAPAYKNIGIMIDFPERDHGGRKIAAWLNRRSDDRNVESDMPFF